MTAALQAQLKRRPLLAFFAIAFAFTWLFWIPCALASQGLITLPVDPVVFHMLGAFGPCVAAVALAAIGAGKAGIRQLIAPLLRWRVSITWYAIVLLMRPAIWLFALAAHILAGERPVAQPIDSAFYAAYFVSQLLVVGVSEELGWSGFAFPKLKARWGMLAGALVLGAIWSLWHLPLFFTAWDSQYGSSFLLYAARLIAFRYLFAWSYTQSGSLVMPALFHVSFNVLTELIPLSPVDPLAIALSWLVTIPIAVASLHRRPVSPRYSSIRRSQS
jgi:uncharacterized protein